MRYQEGPLKKLLIIQTDSSYFLLETLNVLAQYESAFQNFETTILVDEKSYQAVRSAFDAIKGITFSATTVLAKSYDLSINLSLSEISWDFHGGVKALNKVGPYREKSETKVTDFWSSYYMTIKSNVPFLTFHLQDIYKHILGIKKVLPYQKKDNRQYKTIAVGYMNPNVFAAGGQEEFINGLSRRFRFAKVKDISEVSLNDHDVLYIGPASLEALKLKPQSSIILASQFQGFNLMPHDDGSYLISTRGEAFKAPQLLDVVEKLIQQETVTDQSYSIYQIDTQNHANAYLNVVTTGEEHFPFYQVYTVIWNFLMSLTEVDLPVSETTTAQKTMIEAQNSIIKKLTRLHEYAMVSLDVILKEAKSSSANSETIEGHLKNLSDMDHTFETVAGSQPMLRPILDYYRIRRGQNEGHTLLEQVQNSILTYHEEHQALQAMSELLEKFIQRKSVPLSR